ncbi:MAG: transposase [Endozoicomonas sp.]
MCIIQPCIAHPVRNSLKSASYKDRKTVATDLKKIYLPAAVDEAEPELSAFETAWWYNAYAAACRS